MGTRKLVILWILVMIASPAGCVQRRMTIRSNPPGALVYVDDYSIGTTPVSTSFLYYGTRKIRLVKDGYETLTVMQPVPAPWYEIPPLDFFSENVVPGELRDHRVLEYNLTPQVVVPPEQLLQRAEQLRQGQPRGSPGLVAPASPGMRVTPGPYGPPSPLAPGTPEPIGTPAPIGGQQVQPLPPRY